MHFHCETVTDVNGKPEKLSGLAQDITHLKKMEESLLKQFEGLKFISDQAGLGLWQMDINTHIISRLNNDQDFFDSDNKENSFSFDDLKRLTHPEDLSILESRFEQLFNGSEDRIEVEVRIKRKDVYRWIYIYGVTKYIPGNGPELIEGLYQDVTEKKEIEGRLYQSQKMEAIGRLAGGVAHDFNNILQVIMGYSSLALMGIDSENEIFEYISNIVDSGEKAKNLVKQLLLFARKEKFRPGLVAPNEMAADLIRLFTRIMGDNISIEFKPDPELHNIYADSGQLEQVIMNLCINAKDAMTDGGKILVKTENIELGESWRSSDITIPKGSYAVITVSDTGPGIPSENISKIFEPFFTTKERHRGTGLGLAMVYSIIRHHGGYVDVTSIEGKGTTFRIYLPVIEGVEKIADEQKQEIYPRGIIGNATVLLAEDDKNIRDYTKRILTDAGYAVFDCANGEEALKLYFKMKENIDILVFDVMMPGKNGWDTYRKITEDAPEIPVVFFSGYDENILSPHFSDLVNVKYIQKPFKYFVLINAVQELIDKSRLS
jgi:signal transduction histidine kinase/CheY-like chemotaxis protein